MKFILTVVMICSLLTGINANQSATIVIKSDQGNPVIVELNNRQSNHVSSNHKFERIRPGNHRVRIISPGRYHSGHVIYHGKVKAFQGYRTIYKISRGRLILVNKKPVAQSYSQPTSCGCQHNGPCRPSACSCNSCPNYHPNNGHGQYQNNNSCYPRPKPRSDVPSNYGGWNYYNQNSYGNNNQSYNYDEYDQSDYYGPRNEYRQPMNNAQFNRLMRGLENTSFEGDKVGYLKDELKNERVSTQQARVIIEDLFFEDNKLAAAKILYPITVDAANFKQLSDTLKFSSSKEAFAALIK